MGKQTFILFGVLLLLSVGCTEEKQKPIDQCITDVGELEIVNYEISVIAKDAIVNEGGKKKRIMVDIINDLKNNIGGQRLCIYSGIAEVTGYIDLRKLDVEDFSRDSINRYTVKIPHLTDQNFKIKLDEQNIKREFKRVEGIRFDYSGKEIEEIKKSMEKIIRDRIKEINLVDDLENNSKSALKLLGKRFGYNLSVQFIDNKDAQANAFQN